MLVNDSTDAAATSAASSNMRSSVRTRLRQHERPARGFPSVSVRMHAVRLKTVQHEWTTRTKRTTADMGLFIGV